MSPNTKAVASDSWLIHIFLFMLFLEKWGRGSCLYKVPHIFSPKYLYFHPGKKCSISIIFPRFILKLVSPKDLKDVFKKLLLALSLENHKLWESLLSLP
jgi:hypothetical protein